MWYKNGQEFGSEQAIRRDNPNTSLPSFLSDEMKTELGYTKLVIPAQPECTEVQYVVEDGVELVDEVPTRKWKVVDKFGDIVEYIAPDGTVYPAMTKEEQEAKFYADKAEAEAKALKTMFTNTIQQMLDAKAQEKGYDNIVSACSYAGYDNPFRAEGEAYGVWRASCWQVGYALLAEVQTGTKPMPTVEEVLALMPTLVLP